MSPTARDIAVPPCAAGAVPKTPDTTGPCGDWLHLPGSAAHRRGAGRGQCGDLGELRLRAALEVSEARLSRVQLEPSGGEPLPVASSVLRRLELVPLRPTAPVPFHALPGVTRRGKASSPKEQGAVRVLWHPPPTPPDTHPFTPTPSPSTHSAQAFFGFL